MSHSQLTFDRKHQTFSITFPGPDAAGLVLLAMNENGRCSVHAGAAGDQVQVLEEMMALRVSATVVDGEGCSPADVATENGAYIAGGYF